MPMSACYTMDLYCDVGDPIDGSSSYGLGLPIYYGEGPVPPGHHRFNEFPHQFLGETFGQCKRQAQASGWTFKRDGRVICPRCSGKKD